MGMIFSGNHFRKSRAHVSTPLGPLRIKWTIVNVEGGRVRKKNAISVEMNSLASITLNVVVAVNTRGQFFSTKPVDCLEGVEESETKELITLNIPRLHDFSCITHA